MSFHRPIDRERSDGNDSPIAPRAVETLALPRLGRLSIRPLTLGDWPAYNDFGFSLDREDLRLRFGQSIVMEGDNLCARLLAIDHDREEAFAAFDAHGTIRGVVRLVRISDTEGDIALIVRSDSKRSGLGGALLDRLIRYAKAIGLTTLHGDVLHENHPMLELARHAGFHRIAFNGTMVEIRLELTKPASA
jgi:acetyltransferase